MSVRLDDGEGLGDYGEMTPKKAKPAAGARAGDVKGPPGKRGKSALGGSKRAQHGKPGVEAERRGQHANRQKAKPKVKAKAGAGRSARITVEPKAPVKVVKAKPWDASQALPDGQWELFCRKMAEGPYSLTSAYMQAYPDVERDSARSNVHRLIAKDSVRERIEWLKAEAARLFVVNKAEIVRDLYVAWKTPIGYVDPESPLAQEVTYDAETGAITKVKMPGKTDMLKLLVQMEGLEKPKEMMLTVNYEPPNAAMERMKGKGIDVAEILKKAGVLK